MHLIEEVSMTKKQKILISLFIKARRSRRDYKGGKLDTEAQSPVCVPTTPIPVVTVEMVEKKQCETKSLTIISVRSQT